MKKEILDIVVEKTNELINAFSCSKEAKEAAEEFLAAIGTENETDETKKYIAELEADIVTAEGLEAFAGSEAGAKVFGEEKAKEVAAHARELKAQGIKYCDCPACKAVEAILANKENMLAE